MDITGRQAADTILDKGVRVQLPAPFLLSLVFVRSVGFILRQPTLGQLLRVSSVALAAGFDLGNLESGGINEAHRLVKQHARALAKIAALLMLRGRLRGQLFAGLLARWLVWKLTPRKLAEITLISVAMSGIEDFTSTIRLIGAMRITHPKNLSHDSDGS